MFANYLISGPAIGLKSHIRATNYAISGIVKKFVCSLIMQLANKLGSIIILLWPLIMQLVDQLYSFKKHIRYTNYAISDFVEGGRVFCHFTPEHTAILYCTIILPGRDHYWR